MAKSLELTMRKGQGLRLRREEFNWSKGMFMKKESILWFPNVYLWLEFWMYRQNLPLKVSLPPTPLSFHQLPDVYTGQGAWNREWMGWGRRAFIPSRWRWRTQPLGRPVLLHYSTRLKTSWHLDVLSPHQEALPILPHNSSHILSDDSLLQDTKWNLLI